jgi:ferrous iron transport protein A
LCQPFGTRNALNFIQLRLHQRHYMPAPQPLTSVSLGAIATVAQINVPAGSRARLMEMGLLVGTKVELVRFAPMGDPVEIKVRGYNLTLRKSEAEQILVNPA